MHSEREQKVAGALLRLSQPVTVTLSGGEWNAVRSYLIDAEAYHRSIAKRSKHFNRNIRNSRADRARRIYDKIQEQLND